MSFRTKKLSAVKNDRKEILQTRLKTRKLQPMTQYITQRCFLPNTVTKPLSGHLHLSSCSLSGFCPAGNLLSAGRDSKMRGGRWRRCVLRRCAVWNSFLKIGLYEWKRRTNYLCGTAGWRYIKVSLIWETLQFAVSTGAIILPAQRWTRVYR